MGSHRGGSSTVAAGTLDAGGMEDEEEEITADTLRCRHRPLPLSALSAFSYIPPRRLDPKEHSYYYRQGQLLEEGPLAPGAALPLGSVSCRPGVAGKQPLPKSPRHCDCPAGRGHGNPSRSPPAKGRQGRRAEQPPAGRARLGAL